jgi:hypothetical protein
MRNILIITGVCFVALVASGVNTAFAGAKCKCRFNGGYIEEGQTACLKTPTGMSLARCEKVLNNTSWKTLNQPCPFALNDLRKKRFQTPFPALSISNS